MKGEDFCICEIGGTVGDIEGLPFLEAARQFAARENSAGAKALFIHVTLAPPDPGGDELKTKPTHSIRCASCKLRAFAPICWSCVATRPLGGEARRKLALFCNVDNADIMVAENAEVLYSLPLILSKQKMEHRVLEHFSLHDSSQDEGKETALDKWQEVTEAVQSPTESVRIGVIGKYTGLRDAYLSLNEALVHGGIANLARVETHWLESDQLMQNGQDLGEQLSVYDGLLVH